MATIYITDETLEELDKQLEEYNSTHPPTDRSGYVMYTLTNNKKKK